MPQDVYERIEDEFVLKERGDVDVKGKGLMHTWYLVGRRNGDEAHGCRTPVGQRSESSVGLSR